jgi:hypothetical protein
MYQENIFPCKVSSFSSVYRSAQNGNLWAVKLTCENVYSYNIFTFLSCNWDMSHLTAKDNFDTLSTNFQQNLMAAVMQT